MVEMVDIERQAENEHARELYKELLIEARENIAELKKEHVNYSRQINLAKMIELVVDENEELLLEHEQLTLKEWKSRIIDLEKRLTFWQERHKKLQQYDPENFFDTVDTKMEIENFIASIPDSPNADLEE